MKKKENDLVEKIRPLADQIKKLNKQLLAMAEVELQSIIAEHDTNINRIGHLHDQLCDLALWGEGAELHKKMIAYVQTFNQTEADDIERHCREHLEEMEKPLSDEDE